MRFQYAGDGFTRNNEGQKGLTEYIASNKSIAALAKASTIDLTDSGFARDCEKTKEATDGEEAVTGGM